MSMASPLARGRCFPDKQRRSRAADLSKWHKRAIGGWEKSFLIERDNT